VVLLVLAVTVGAAIATTACTSGEAAQAKEHEEAGRALVEQQDWQGAITEFSTAIDLDPKSDRAYEDRGTAQTELGNYDQAISDLTKAIEIAPDRVGPYYARAVAYRETGDLESALADYSKAIGDLSKTRWRTALYERGTLYVQLGRRDEARADFQRILQLEQEKPGEAGDNWDEMAQQELAKLGQ
jgi:tetratricopeptide (TPR) repeat protein